MKMTTAVEPTPSNAEKKLYKVADLLAMPDDGVKRWLIRGQLREKRGFEMTKRNRFHASLTARISQLIGMWLDQQPEPRGEVYDGEAGVYIRRNPDSAVGVDVVYLAPGVQAAQTDQTTLIDGIPTLVVEVLSPSNTVEEVNDKTDEYLEAGVPLIWIVDPHLQTVTVLSPGQPPELFNTTHTLSADPHLPGFTIPVIRIFRR
jgi:Uma2 family endonuclease